MHKGNERERANRLSNLLCKEPMCKGVFAMVKRFAVFAAVFALGLALAAPVRAQDSAPAKEGASAKDSTPASSQSLLEAAQQKAQKQHKPIMVLFDASW